MRTVEELEALVETLTRERDLSLSAWESAGMQGRDAQSAMLELARQLEEARAIVGSCWLTYSEGERDKARAWAHQCERERDEARAEVRQLRERVTEHQSKFESGWAVLCKERDEARAYAEDRNDEANKLQRFLNMAATERDEARDTIAALTTAMAEKDLEIATLTAALDERDVEAERGLEQYDRLMHQLADQTNETTRVRLEAKRAGEDAYRRGAEAMREACEVAIHAAPDGSFAELVIRATPIPQEEP